MKRNLLISIILLSAVFNSVSAQLQTSQIPQTSLEPDQNPNFAISRDKYMKIADSLNSWHSTTLQETYDAIDWLEDKRQAKAARQEFRRQIRLERARRWYGYYYDDYNYSPRRGYYNNYNYNYNRNYRRNRSSWFWCW